MIPMNPSKKLNSGNNEKFSKPESNSLIDTNNTESQKNVKKSTKSSLKTDSIKDQKIKTKKNLDNDSALIKGAKSKISPVRKTKKKVSHPENDITKDKKDKIKVKKEKDKISEQVDNQSGMDLSHSDLPQEGEGQIKDTRSSEVANYLYLSKEDLYKVLEELIHTKPVNDIRHDVETIKINFYRKYKSDVDYLKRKFIEEGGVPEEFVIPHDSLEEKIRELLKKYRDLKAEQNRIQDDQKLINLKLKYEIIEEIKELINSEESINKTFHEFRELQNRWREIGVVPQQNLNDLWETYHHHVEKFYDYIKINKELRDLDLKKNLELKIQICEKTESLLLDPNIVNAFTILQKFHEQWREIGPVPKEMRTEIWERFKEATSKINKKHQQYYQDIKESQKRNLESKTLLCEKVEKINTEKTTHHKDWVAKTNEILELQKIWKTIGFAPKKENNKIYARFRTACDVFFENKREFYSQTLEEQRNNLQLKLDLCVQAEALKNSTEWKKTSDEYIKLQKRWKQIGPVPRKQSDAIWKRFRTACDNFFEKKAEFFSKIDNSYDSNLKAKEELIKEISEFQKTENLDLNLTKLKEYQRKWMEIGFVPYNKKQEIQDQYREAINKFYDSLEIDDFRRNILKFKDRLDSILQRPKPEIKLRFERDKYMNKLQQLKNDIAIWENNIGFFGNSKNADSMIKDFEEKIKNAKLMIRTLEEKIILIDDLDFDL